MSGQQKIVVSTTALLAEAAKSRRPVGRTQKL